MNLIEELKTSDKGVSTQNILRDKACATLLQIKAGSVLKEHQSTTNAMLVLLSGKAIYKEETRSESLSKQMDIVEIPAHVTHKVTGVEDAVLLLIQ